ncbi:MAG: NAD+ synthase [Thermodesulfobacteriota bacterium]
MTSIRIAMAQVNPTVGDLKGNASLVLEYTERARKEGADLVVFPELVITGYPPEDLLLKPAFIKDNMRTLGEISEKITNITAVIGFVDKNDNGIFNGAALVHDGAVAGVYHKMFLPNYGVFDEKRYFSTGKAPVNFVLKGITMGLGVCEDIWTPEGPARLQSACGAAVIININASPYHMEKAAERESMLMERALDNGVAIVYNNMVGGQDELVFDGHGLIIGSDGSVLARAEGFTETLLLHDLAVEAKTIKKSAGEEKEKKGSERIKTITLPPLKQGEAPATAPFTPEIAPLLEPCEEVYRALVMGTRDYAKKNNFGHAVLALSGGIDSALVAALAAEALGSENITCVFMPSGYTSTESREDAVELAANLGITLLTKPIDDILGLYLKGLAPFFADRPSDVTEENLQARIRGDIIMALSNKFGWLVLTTGNKSELSVGYATLYGDMAGGFSVIKDVPKTLVYRLSEWINKSRGQGETIPRRIITKAPSAELRKNQRDDDTLPPYDKLDTILKAYVEEDQNMAEIAAMGFNEGLVKRVIGLVDRSEYKRRQAAPGVRITPRAFGRDRRMPITNRYKGWA